MSEELAANGRDDAIIASRKQQGCLPSELVLEARRARNQLLSSRRQRQSSMSLGYDTLPVRAERPVMRRGEGQDRVASAQNNSFREKRRKETTTAHPTGTRRIDTRQPAPLQIMLGGEGYDSSRDRR
jgi:hypothetical protein